MEIKEPQRFSNMIGQDKIRESLAILIAAARRRGEALDHLLFVGSSGLGKTTFANMVANEMGVNLKVVSGSTIERKSDMAAILTNLRAGDVLFIDEIHRLSRPVEEVLYSAMEDFAFDIVIGKGPSARSIRLKLPRFTVVGTTSKLAQVDEQLTGLMLVYDFAPYDAQDVGIIILSLAKQQGIAIDMQAANVLAEYCNGNPGRAATLLKKIDKFALVRADGYITPAIVKDALSVFGFIDILPVRDRQPIPDDAKIFVWQRDNGRCVICGSQENLEYDHIIPISKGGSNTARNIQLLCEKHNRSKGGNLV